MKTFLEKGYGWPLLVIGLLSSSVVVMGFVVMAARSDGGAQVIDDYYGEAVRWDSLAHARQAASRLGWSATLDMSSDLRGMEGMVSLVDSAGMALTGLHAIVQLRRPQLADVVAELAAEHSGVSGSYAFSTAASGSGLWDIQIVFTDPANPQHTAQFNWRREFR